MSPVQAVRGATGRVVLVAALVGMVLVGSAAQAGAAVTPNTRTPRPKITLTASPKVVTNGAGTVTLSYNVTNASSCAISPNPAAHIFQSIGLNCGASPAGTQSAVLPLNTGKRAVTYSFTFTASGTSTKSKTVKVKVNPGAGQAALAGATSVSGNGYGSECAIVTSGGVDCWGSNNGGSIGSGSPTGPQPCGNSQCATTAVPVVGLGGVGKLAGVAQLAVDGTGTYCARLTSGGVDCWGPESDGELGNNSGTGAQNCQGDGWACSPTPVQVVDANGPLTGVTDLHADAQQAFCALLASGGVDCWGGGNDGDTGNGVERLSNPIAVPVIAVGSEGSLNPSPLMGVASLSDGGIGFCGILSTSGVVCWGLNRFGNLGMGAFGTGPNSCGGEGPGYGDCSAEPQVVVTSDQTPLTGVTKVVPDSLFGWCAVLSSKHAECWGDNVDGEIGNGSISNPLSCSYGPCLPYATPVVDTTGSGTLSGVTDVVSSVTGGMGDQYPTMCAIVTSGALDCWGSNKYNALGNSGINDHSATPVSVDSPGTTNPLTGVTQMAGDGEGFCALVSGGLDCWGVNEPVSPVASVGNTGALGGVTRVTSMPYGSVGYCAILASGGVDCLDGGNEFGELGDGGFAAPSVPTAPSAPYYNESPTSVFGP